MTEVTTVYYRGYALVSNDLGTDIWAGEKYVSTEYGPSGVDKAKGAIDGWHHLAGVNESAPSQPERGYERHGQGRGYSPRSQPEQEDQP